MSKFVQVKNSNLLSYPATFNTIGQPLTLLDSVDSTNNYAMARVQDGSAGHGAGFFAREQTAGKGQRGKAWNSQPGENIILSLVLKPPAATVNKPFLLSAAIALACYDFFKIFAGEETRIKWPNDLYWRDRKAGGILIENIIRSGSSGWQWAIVGTGININQTLFDPGIQQPVSLKQITGKTHDVTELTRMLCGEIEKKYQRLSTHSATELMDTYNSVLYKRHEKVKLRKDSMAFDATIDRVTEEGLLITKNSLQTEFRVGELVWER
jgi:BirA family biotin operon repressor/biotin-[acetyl-CoA-carboxylase] ligase